MAVGFVCRCVLLPGGRIVPWPLLLVVFLLLGMGVVLPMSAVSLFVGTQISRAFRAVLAFLNFRWSAGALLAPLFAAWLLAPPTFASRMRFSPRPQLVAALAVLPLLLRDTPESGPDERGETKVCCLDRRIRSRRISPGGRRKHCGSMAADLYVADSAAGQHLRPRYLLALLDWIPRLARSAALFFFASRPAFWCALRHPARTRGRLAARLPLHPVRRLSPCSSRLRSWPRSIPLSSREASAACDT